MHREYTVVFWMQDEVVGIDVYFWKQTRVRECVCVACMQALGTRVLIRTHVCMRVRV